MIDLAVVGGGPVGLVAALMADAVGLRVVVVEQRSGPVDKACGEGVMPAGLHILDRIGVNPPGFDIEGIRYLDDGRSVDAAFSAGPGRGVRRTALMSTVAGELSRRGIPICEDKVVCTEQRGEGVLLSMRSGAELAAGYVVAADGLHSPIRSALGLDAPTRPGAKRRGLRRHYAVEPWATLVEVHWSPYAEAYVTPVGNDLVSVAVLSQSAGTMDDHLARFPALVDRFAGAVIATSDRGAGPFRQRSRARVAGRVLLVGDAAGYVDAITGEGLTVGWRMAAAAVAAIRRGDPAAYERRWPGIVRRSTWLTSGLVAAARVPPVRRMIVPAASAVPPLYRSLVNLAARG